MISSGKTVVAPGIRSACGFGGDWPLLQANVDENHACGRADRHREGARERERPLAAISKMHELPTRRALALLRTQDTEPRPRISLATIL